MLNAINFEGLLFLHSQLNIYVFYAYCLILSILFIYKIFQYMPKYGFSKESSMDVAVLSVMIYAASFLVLNGNFTTLESVYEYYFRQFWYISLVMCVVFITLVCRLSRWSIFKVLDIFATQSMLIISLSFFGLFIFNLKPFFIFVFLITLLYYFLLLKASESNFNSFAFFSFIKHDDYSFIGASFLFSSLLLTGISLAGLLIFYVYIPIIVVNILLLFFIVYLLIKRSKKFKIKWTIQQNLLKHKNKNSNKSVKMSQESLID